METGDHCGRRPVQAMNRSVGVALAGTRIRGPNARLSPRITSSESGSGISTAMPAAGAEVPGVDVQVDHRGREVVGHGPADRSVHRPGPVAVTERVSGLRDG